VLLKLDFDAMIPGHGKIMTKDAVHAYRVRFQTMHDRVRELIRKGVQSSIDGFKTLDQARGQLRRANLGWDNSVSTTTWFGRARYDDEIVASR
jgi:hypothetical protein